MTHVSLRLGIVALALALASCAHSLEVVQTDQADAPAIAFLLDGETAREQVAARLGQPSAQFENGRIMTYRLDRKFRVLSLRSRDDSEHAGWQQARYSLVLIFDDQGILARHRLLRVR
ncbi:MAG: hypothetical protein JSV80_06245 [Acidobacteriota bacterium]|nr:MAG: hypothetical protein JSV80_06245 [Acidobacteriota bacterium]